MARQLTHYKAFLVMALTLAIAACANGGATSDDALTAKVKEALIMDNSVPATRVHVTTMQGVVQLSGFVDNPQAEVNAVRDANNVAGVKSVDDKITVRSGTH